MVRLFVRHSVNDYAAWRTVYDGFGPFQVENGVISETVYQSVDDPNDVTVTHDFESIDAARAFVENPILRDAIERAGVAGAPTIWIVTEA